LNNIKVIKKKVKNFSIKITGDGEVCLTAPLYSSQQQINSLISDKQKWIDKKLAYIKSLPKPPSITLNEGEIIHYLGKSYTIKIEIDTKNSIDLQDNYILFWLKKDDIDSVTIKTKLLYSWYKKQAIVLFNIIIDNYSKKLNVEVNRVSIKKMKTRWGSCNSKKLYINLNLELIKTPIKAIEYVILHELSHITHPNHSKSFYEYMSRFMSDYKDNERLLKVISI